MIVEARVHICVVILDRLVLVLGGGCVDFGTVLEEFVQNGLLLVVVDAHTLTLDSAVELVLTLLILVVISRRVACLHTLGILGGVREGQQLLLQLGGHVDTRKVGRLGADPHLVPRLIPQEDALLLLVTLHA